MTKHTQGPWIIIWPDNNKNIAPRIKTESFGTICRTNDIWPTENGYEENKANTLLLAAAPELLELLHCILMQHKTNGAYCSYGDVGLSNAMCSRIERALAKAKGV